MYQVELDVYSAKKSKVQEADKICADSSPAFRRSLRHLFDFVAAGQRQRNRGFGLSVFRPNLHVLSGESLVNFLDSVHECAVCSMRVSSPPLFIVSSTRRFEWKLAGSTIRLGTRRGISRGTGRSRTRRTFRFLCTKNVLLLTDTKNHRSTGRESPQLIFKVKVLCFVALIIKIFVCALVFCNFKMKNVNHL